MMSRGRRRRRRDEDLMMMASMTPPGLKLKHIILSRLHIFLGSQIILLRPFSDSIVARLDYVSAAELDFNDGFGWYVFLTSFDSHFLATFHIKTQEDQFHLVSGVAAGLLSASFQPSTSPKQRRTLLPRYQIRTLIDVGSQMITSRKQPRLQRL